MDWPGAAQDHQFLAYKRDIAFMPCLRVPEHGKINQVYGVFRKPIMVRCLRNIKAVNGATKPVSYSASRQIFSKPIAASQFTQIQSSAMARELQVE
jgi:hypothetical protein